MLRYLKNCGVVYVDIKFDNVLVNESYNVLKLCDFGSAMFDGDNELTSYLVSRFYCVLEVIFGLLYLYFMDLWLVGCCLYELFIGNILFLGCLNNYMLKFMFEFKGFVSKKLFCRVLFKDNYYDFMGIFLVVEEDFVMKKSICCFVCDVKLIKDLLKIFTRDFDMSDGERKKAF